jgi:hypothetical protein
MNPKIIYNADEIGLLFRLPPHRTLSLKGVLAMVERIARINSNLLACSVTWSNKLLLLGRMKTFIALKMSVCHNICSQRKKHGLQRLPLLIFEGHWMPNRAVKSRKRLYCS